MGLEHIIEVIDRHIDKSLEWSKNALIASAVKRLKAGKKEAWGKLVLSITGQVVHDKQLQFQLKFGSNVPYARYVEEGRRPGKYPPFAEIDAWVKKKRQKFGNFMMDKETGEDLTTKERKIGNFTTNEATWLVARKLKQKGTEAYPFLRWSVEQNMDKILAKIAEEIALGVKELNGTA